MRPAAVPCCREPLEAANLATCISMVLLWCQEAVFFLLEKLQ